MFVSTQMNETARSARLVLAIATRTPNLSISGSFWNCGAPPESVITVAMLSAPSTEATIVAANAANQSSALGSGAVQVGDAGEDRQRDDGRDARSC